jgi:hypothetical protein
MMFKMTFNYEPWTKRCSESDKLNAIPLLGNFLAMEPLVYGHSANIKIMVNIRPHKQIRSSQVYLVGQLHTLLVSERE